MKDDDTLDALQKLRRMVPEPQEAHGLVMLLGNGLAEAMAGMRARQATLEFVRAEARRSASVDVRRAEAEASADAVAAVHAEVRRLRVTEPRAGDGVVGVYGHVLDGGEPVIGAQVALVDGDEALACIDTDKAGSFALSLKFDRALALRISVDGKVVHRDDRATTVPGPVATYRLVELGEATTPAPSQGPCHRDKRPRPSTPLPRPGQTLIQTLKLLKADHVPVTVVRLSASNDATPRVADIRAGDGSIGLEVHGRVTDVGRLAVVASVLAHQPEAERAGIGSASAAAVLLKKGQVTTWDEVERASRLNAEHLADHFGLDRDRAEAFGAALATTMSTIKIVEEG